jgi:hypothetical protein
MDIVRNTMKTASSHRLVDWASDPVQYAWSFGYDKICRRSSEADVQTIYCGGVTMAPTQRSAFDECLLESFQDILERYNLEFQTHRVGRSFTCTSSHLEGHVWELIFSCGSYVSYSAWVAMAPGSTPDLLDVIVPNALELPGPVPRYVVDLPALSPAFQQRLLRQWARAIQAHDELQALIASVTPDTATAVRLLTELRAASVLCKWERITQGVLSP